MENFSTLELSIMEEITVKDVYGFIALWKEEPSIHLAQLIHQAAALKELVARWKAKFAWNQLLAQTRNFIDNQQENNAKENLD